MNYEKKENDKYFDDKIKKVFKTNLDDLKKEIADAEYVLVGIGEEWKFSKNSLGTEEIERKKEMFKGDETGLLGEYFENQFVANYSIDQLKDKENNSLLIRNAYLNLLELISTKNYYVISMVRDSYMDQLGFDTEKIVQPCGNQKWLQCPNGCDEQLYDVTVFENLISDYQKLFVSGSELELFAAKQKLPKCEVCGSKLVFNNVDATRYLEKGYLKKWEDYTIWMQKTLNRKVCMLELGVSLTYPTVIRWPFEKIAFFNQKSKLFRVNGTLFQLSEEIAEKSVSIKQNSVDLFANIFV